MKISTKVWVGTALLLVVIWPLLHTDNLVAAIPIFTGDAAADFTGPDVIKIDDPSFEVGRPDVGLPVQFPDERISGWDMNAVYLEYDVDSDTLYVGIDCFGICGDADGDGDPGTTGPILESLQAVDRPNFESTESFAFLIDTDNSCDVEPNSAFDVVVGVPLGPDISGVGAFTFAGLPASPSVGFGAPLTNTVTLFANPSADAPDLEFSIADFSTLPGFDDDPETPLSYQINVFLGSLEDDGIGEDFLPGTSECVPVIPPPATPTPEPPTPTPTETPTTPPAETPTTPATSTPEPPTPTPEPPTPTPEPPTPTPEPPMTTPEPPTPTPEPPTTVPPTMAPPTMAPPTMAPPTVPPPPTMLPPTGPDASASSSSAQIEDRIVVPYHGPSPAWIEIDAIDVASQISPMSWYYESDVNGNSIPKWDVTNFGVGWHINSAHIGSMGNAVMSGHNTINGSVFKNLPSLKRGDIVSVWDNTSNEFRYVVDQVRVVPEKEIDIAQQQENAQWLTDFGDERLTLISCWPERSSEYRVIVVAHREELK